MMNVRIFIHEMYDRTEKPSKSTIRNQKKSSTFCSYTHTSNFGRLIVGYSRLRARARDAPAQILTRSHRGMVLTCLIVQRDWLGHKCCSDVHGLFKQSSIRKPKKKKIIYSMNGLCSTLIYRTYHTHAHAHAYETNIHVTKLHLFKP